MQSPWLNRLLRRFYPSLHVWHSPDYRLPISSVESQTGIEPRRADYALWYALDQRIVPARQVHAPAHRITFGDMERAHSPGYLESLDRPEMLARIFGVIADDLPVAEIQRTVRLAAQGTLEATRHTLEHRHPTLNLLGGFHHAEPHKGGGFCPINDIAIAIARVRADGFRGAITILDLDAHPPDGLSAFFAEDPDVFIGSLSGTDWGTLPGVDETVLESGVGDEGYLDALDALLDRTPSADLAYVIAGGDVLKGDRNASLDLTLDGARRRDLRVLDHLGRAPQVWLPGGGYSNKAWKALAGTTIAAALRTRAPISSRFDPMRARFSYLRSTADSDEIEGPMLTEEDLFGLSGTPYHKLPRYLGYYSREGVAYGLHRYGILNHLKRLGYEDFRVALNISDPGERMQLYGNAAGEEHLLIECVLEKRDIEGLPMLFIHWLTLRHPRAHFSSQRPSLPGQETPGLGLAREAAELVRNIARRLDLAGMAYNPAWFHTAYAGRHDLRFIDPRRQGRFLALIRDAKPLALLETTLAIDQGLVELDGARYTWEADTMAHWFEHKPDDRAIIEAERDRVVFRVVRPGTPRQ